MHIGVSYKQHPPSGAFDAIVIGSGIGGLAAASALARFGGQRVLVLERHYRIGGYTHSFSRRGYEWDVGIHYMGELGPRGGVRKLLDRLTDGSVQWAPLPDVYDRIVLGDRSYDFVTGTRRFIARMTEYFPSEADAIARYVTLVKRVVRSGALYYADRALPKGASRALGPLMRRRFLRYATRTTLDVMRDLTTDEELIAVLTGQFGDYGLPPSRASFAMHASVAAHYFGGAYFPIGGASVIAKAFAPVIEREGGVLCHSADVSDILVESGRAVGVRVAGGGEYRAKVVISDAGASNTFRRLLPEGAVPPAFVDALGSVAPSVSYMCLYVGLRHTDEELGLTGTNLWLYRDHRHDENIQAFLDDPEAPLPLVYASFPSAKDPSFQERFPGRSTIDLITLCPWEWVEKWAGTSWMKRGKDYDEMKAGFSARLLETLYERLPQLRGKVDHAELSTPLTAAHFSGHPRGELYGLDHSPARYRLPLRAETPVGGLYLTGADLVSAGVAGGLLGGVVTAGSLLGLRFVRGLLRG